MFKAIFQFSDMFETMFLEFEDMKDVIYEMFDKMHSLKGKVIR